MGKFSLHSLEIISLEVRRLLQNQFFLGNLLLLIHLHVNPVFLLHPDEDGTFIHLPNLPYSKGIGSHAAKIPVLKVV